MQDSKKKNSEHDSEQTAGPLADGGEADALSIAVRDAYRSLSRALQGRIAEHGVSVGQWFFLRALWETDGLTQRELSQRVGLMEPTTVNALQGMERNGLVERIRNPQDRRKINVFLTPKGRELRDLLLPCAAAVDEAARRGIGSESLEEALTVLRRVVENMAATEKTDLPSADAPLG